MFFKLKDVFTLGNLTLSLYIVVVVMGGRGPDAWGARVEEASLLCVFGWLFDGLDGIVARLTKTANEFGSQFDNLTDLFVYSVAPAFVLHEAYRPTSEILAFGLLAFVIGIGSIRLARFNTKPLDYPGYWIGLPRPAVGLFIVFLLNSHAFRELQLLVPAIALILLAGVLNLGFLPYRNHKKSFNKPRLIGMYLIVLTAVVLHQWGLMWDFCLVWMLAYMVSPFLFISRRERRAVAEFVAEWKKGEFA